MTPLRREIRTCIEQFIEDMTRMVCEAITERVEADLARLDVSTRRTRGSGTRRPRRSDGARRSKRREERVQKPKPSRRRPDGPRELPVAADAPAGADALGPPEAPEAAPAPLFVHRRARDGKIVHLSRGAAPGSEEGSSQHGEAASP